MFWPRSDMLDQTTKMYHEREMELLLCCSQVQPDINRIRELIEGGLNWEELVRIADHNGLKQLLYYNLRRNCPEAVPTAIINELHRTYHLNAIRCIILTDELLRLLERFEGSGIPATPFKGPALSQQIFGNIRLRKYSDLDIVVPKQEMLKAKDILISEGYQPALLLNAAQEKLFLKTECEYTFYHPTSKTMVEIHWQFVPSCYAISFKTEKIWSRTESMLLDGKKIKVLSAEDLLIALCIHGIGHRWKFNQLKLICDIAGLLNMRKDLNWEIVLSYASKARIERILFLGLIQANELFGVEIPEKILEKAQHDPAIKLLMAYIWDQSRSDLQRPSELRDEIIFWYRCREHLADRLNCIARLMFQPTAVDWSIISLPASLYSLYYLIHPLRVIHDSKSSVEK